MTNSSAKKIPPTTKGAVDFYESHRSPEVSFPTYLNRVAAGWEREKAISKPAGPNHSPDADCEKIFRYWKERRDSVKMTQSAALVRFKRLKKANGGCTAEEAFTSHSERVFKEKRSLFKVGALAPVTKSTNSLLGDVCMTIEAGQWVFDTSPRVKIYEKTELEGVFDISGQPVYKHTKFTPQAFLKLALGGSVTRTLVGTGAITFTFQDGSVRIFRVVGEESVLWILFNLIHLLGEAKGSAASVAV